MALVGKSGSGPQMEQLAAPPKPAPVQPRMPPRPAMVSGREHVDFVPTASIDGQAGVRHGLHPRATDLGHYVAVAARLGSQRYVPMRGSRGSVKTDRKSETEEEEAFLEAVQDSLVLLAEDSGRHSRDELEAQLERYFEPVQRLKVLVESLQRLRTADLPVSKKAAMGRALNAMYTTLMKKHAFEIRAVLQETDEAGAKVDVLSEELPWSVRLRQLIFAKDAGKFDAPFTSLTVLRSLIKYFGPNCVTAMCSLRARMMGGL